MCTPEDDFQGIHLQNPQYVQPDCADVKPFKDLPIHTIARDLWKFQEMQRRMGVDIPYESTDLVEKYFRVHPEERELCLANDPRFDWRMPPAGPEFTPWPAGTSCLAGKFKLAIRGEPTTGEQEDGGSTGAGSSDDVQ